jgi:hypothetical protein
LQAFKADQQLFVAEPPIGTADAAVVNDPKQK